MASFIEQMFAGRTKANVFLCSFANNRDEKSKYPTRDIVTRRPDQVAKFLAKYDVPGRATYFCVNTVKDRKRGKDEIAEINCLHVDIDFKGVVEDEPAILTVLRKLKCKPSCVVASGHGYHVYWLLKPVLGPDHIASTEALLKRVAEILAGDTSAAEISRVLRLPGSHNSKVEGEWLDVRVLNAFQTYTTYTYSDLDLWVESQAPLLTYKSTPKAKARDDRPLNVYQQFYQETRESVGGFDVDDLLDAMVFHDVHGNGIDDTHAAVVGGMVAEDATLEECIRALLIPTKSVYERDRGSDDSAWSERTFLTSIRQKFKYFKRRDTQKVISNHDDHDQNSGGYKKETPTLNGAHFDFDDRLPDEKKKKGIWIAPYNFWGVKPTESLQRGMLPKIIEDVAFEYAERNGYDVDALAMSMLTVCSSMVPTNVVVRNSHEEDKRWSECIRIWQVNVGAPGAGKSPVQDEVLHPLNTIESGLRKRFSEEMAVYKNLNPDDKKQTDEPIRNRVILPDHSVEAAQKAFAQNPDGLLMPSDELISFIGGISRYSNKSGGGEKVSKGFWLSAYDSRSYGTIRMSRADVDCVPSVSILSGTQPDTLYKIVEEASQSDGLIQRFTPVMMFDDMGQGNKAQPKFPWTIYERLVKNMYEHMAMRMTGATLYFSSNAGLVRDKMFQWVEDQKKLYRNNPPLASHINKFRGMFLRFCGLYHVIEHYEDKQPRQISQETATKVYKFMTSCRAKHAEAFYDLVMQNEENNDMRNVADFILAHDLLRVSAREMQHGSARLRKIDSKSIAYTASSMVSLGWLKFIAGKRIDQFNYEVNPDVHRQFKQHADVIKQQNLETRNRLNGK